MEDLYFYVGFVGLYYEETASFFKQYFNSEKKMDSFFYNVFINDDEDKRPRRMMNQVVRWVGLAKDLQKLRPGRDPLTIICIRACLESICNDSDKARFFEKYLSVEGRGYIEKSFQVDVKQYENGSEYNDEKTVIQNFEEMIFMIRNEAVHDGDYWTSQVFAHDDGNAWMSMYHIRDKKGNIKSRVFYETKIKDEQLIKYFVEAAVNYINTYIKNNHPANSDL